jgi:hypothetical protein
VPAREVVVEHLPGMRLRHLVPPIETAEQDPEAGPDGQRV